MLTLYADYVPGNLNIVNDVEKQFALFGLQCTEIEKYLVEKIEQGKLIDSATFTDRFGCKLYIPDLSTGCKAALCVVNCKDAVINLIECGLNARDIIISTCDVGNVLIDTNSATISTMYNRDISVRVDNYLFTDIDRLNGYLFNERPHAPDLNTHGITELR